MDLNVDRLKEVLNSVGCEGKQQGSDLYIMLPANFPWYGGGDKPESENSRIIASVTLSRGDWKFSDAWPMPDISSFQDEPLGVVMTKDPLGMSTGALNALNDFNYEEIANWLQNKIGEVSRVAKKFRQMELEYQSKEYEV